MTLACGAYYKMVTLCNHTITESVQELKAAQKHFPVRFAGNQQVLPPPLAIPMSPLGNHGCRSATKPLTAEIAPTLVWPA